jgi:DtxR family transcriptional regulator, iron-dependent repressor
MEWYNVHDDAERLERAVSPDFEAKLTEKLGRSGICPHGNQTPSETSAARKRRGLMLLTEGETGSDYVIGSVRRSECGCPRWPPKKGRPS